jgi:hypothetical protein
MKVILSLIFSFTLIISYSQDVKSLIREGISFHDKGQYDSAIAKYLEALKLDPKNGTAMYEASFSYSAKKDHQNALSFVNDALKNASGELRLNALIAKGSTLDEMGNKKEAIKIYERALKEFPNNYLLWFNYGITLTTLGRYEEAEKACINALTNNFGHPGSHLQLARLRKSAGSHYSAALCYYFYLMLEPTSTRSEEATNDLFKALYGKDSINGTRTINITIDDIMNPTPAFQAELHLSAIMGIREKKDKADGVTRSPQQIFVADSEEFFKKIPEWKKPKASSGKKKKQQAQSDFYLDNYGTLFADVQAAGFTEPFCYYIMSGKKDPEIEKWLDANKDTSDHFYTWLKTR